MLWVVEVFAFSLLLVYSTVLKDTYKNVQEALFVKAKNWNHFLPQ